MKSSRWQNVLNHFSGLLLFAFIFISAPCAFAGPGKTTYQAKIVKPDGYPLEAANVNFKFSILDPAGSCILYSETYSSVNMSGTGGLISFALGSGVKTYPASATTFENVFSNIAVSLSCDAGGPGSYSPGATDIRKIVMQFHDGNGWQTLPAMSINAVPYAMFANDAAKLNGLGSSDFVQLSTVPTCAASEALRYTGAGFTCISVGSSVTSGTVVTALGYTPADGASLTTVTSDLSTVSSTVASVSAYASSVSATVTSLQNSVSASFATITSSQWVTSGTNIFYSTGNVGIGTTTPVTSLDVSGGIRIGLENASCAATLAGTLRYNATNVEFCNGTSWQAFGVSGAGITNFNGSTSGAQTLATGTAGTAPAFNTLSGVHTLNIPLASAGSVTAGLISNADYVNFSNKITSSAAAIAQVLGYVPADNAASGTYAQKANNLSDLTNVATARTNLGLGSFATANTLDLGSASATGTLAIARLPALAGDATMAAASNTIILSNSGVTAGTYTKVTVDNKGRVTSGAQIASSDVTTALGYTPANSATIVSSQWNTSGTTINYINGNVGIGTTAPAAPLTVNGLALIGGATTNYTGTASAALLTGSSQIIFDGGASSISRLQWNSGILSFGKCQDSTCGPMSPYLDINTTSNITTFYNMNAVRAGNGYGNATTPTFSFGPSTNTGMFNPSAATLSFAVSGTERIRIASTTIGIGTLSPSGVLDIKGSGQAGPNSGANFNILRLGNISALDFGEYAGGQLWMQASNRASYATKPDLIINPDGGNIGIGTTTPTALLNLAAGTTSKASFKLTSGTLLTSPQSGTMEYDGANFYLTDGSNTRRMIATGASAGTIDNASVINSSGNITMVPTGSVVVSSTTASTNSQTGALVVKGGVGVAGNINAAGDLNVSGATTLNSTTLENAGNLKFVAAAGSPNDPGDVVWYNHDLTERARIYSGTGSSPELRFNVSGVTRVLVNSSGNVGIGITTPLKGLHVLSGTMVGTTAGFPADYATVNNEFHSGSLIKWTETSGNTVNNGTYSMVAPTGSSTKNSHSLVNILFTDVTAGASVTGANNSFYNFTVRNRYAANTDNGYVQQMVGFRNEYGHQNSVSGNTPTTGSMYGSVYTPQILTGTISNLYDLYISSPIGSGTLGQHYSIYQESTTAKNYFAGNVGVGTTTPSVKLHVVGGAYVDRIESVTNPATFVIRKARGSVGAEQPVVGDDRVGVISFDAYEPTTGFTGSSVTQAEATISANIDTLATPAVGNMPTYMAFATKPASSTTVSERMRITSNGDIGIGTTAPTAKLDVVNALTSSTDGILLKDSTTTNGRMAIGDATNAASSYVPVMWGKAEALTSGNRYGLMLIGEPAFDSASDAAVVIDARFNSAAVASSPILKITNYNSEKMRVDVNGNVGIGTTAPTAKFEVSRNFNGESNTTAGFIGGIDAGYAATGAYFVQKDNTGLGASTTLLFNVVKNSASQFAVNGLGNVGIGTTSPLATLHVAGTGYVKDSGNSLIELLSRNDSAFNVTNNSATKRGFSLHHENSSALIAQWYHCPSGSCTQKLSFDYAGNMVIAGTLTQSSDIRLKKDILPLQSSLDKILSLNGVSYYWKDKEVPGRQVGLIAQEVEKVFPEIIKKDEKGFLSVGYQNLVAPLIESVKEIYHRLVGIEQQQIEQQRQIASVVDSKADKSEVEKLKAENAALKAYICGKDPQAAICQ